MMISSSLQLALDDLIADLQHSRRQGDLGRLALLAYCEVRRWARNAGQAELAEYSAEMMTGNPHTSREAFLDFIDRLHFDLLRIRDELGSGMQNPGSNLAGYRGEQAAMPGRVDHSSPCEH